MVDFGKTHRTVANPLKERDLRHRVTLLLYHESGVEAVALAKGQSVIIGRAPPADIPIADRSLSRKHARFTLEPDGVLVEDLGSTNGTLLAGEHVEQARVGPADELALGNVVVSIHGRSMAMQGVESYERFLVRLEEEVAQARFFSRPLALLMVLPLGEEKVHLRRWCPRIQQVLRPIDRMALYRAHCLEVLLPEATHEDALKLARAIVERREEGEPALGCGVALFPDAAASAAKLLEVTRLAAEQADESEPVRSAVTDDPSQWQPREVTAESDGQGKRVIASDAMRRVYATVERLGAANIPVLILGETGTGKELIARAIHREGARADGPLRCINCAAIPDQLMESVLFGHEKGAFTGAVQRSKGVFEEADSGTVLLDEVGELSPAAQAALLRTLETKTITRVGSVKEIAVDVRILAATHRDLEQMCDEGTFRPDLLYRLNTMTLELPPLRDRHEEIEPLATLFLEQARAAGNTAITSIDPEALELLHGYHWPGNIRELKNEIERAVVIAGGATITADDLSERIRGPSRTPSGEPAFDPDEDIDFKTRVQRFETRLILGALKSTRWNQAAAARELRIPLRTLAHKIRAFNLKRPEKRS